MKDELDLRDLKRPSPSDQELHLRELNRGLMEENKRLHSSLGRQKEHIAQVCGAVAAAAPYPAFAYPKSNSKTAHPVEPVLMLSDLHIGEVVERDEVEGFNRYNWDIAQAGLFGIVEDFLRWVEAQRQWYRIEQCTVLCEGDYVSGDIHDELKATNEFPLPVQTANAGTLLGEVFRILAGHFKRVSAIECGADNHGRLQKKPQAKQKAQNSMSYLVHHIANAAASRCANVVPKMAIGMKELAAINGRKFLCEHGDTIRGWAGLPFYGFQREVGREAVRRMNTSRGFDYLCIGHFHVPTFLENRIIVNGSLSGTSEFDHACGRHAHPCQVAFLVHPAHGIFNLTPFVRRDVKPNQKQ